MGDILLFLQLSRFLTEYDPAYAGLLNDMLEKASG